MKLVTFLYNNKQLIGAVDKQYIIPVDVAGLDNLIDFIQADKASKQRFIDKVVAAEDRIALLDVKLQAPIQKPPKFFGVALNYVDHIEETGLKRPEYPLIFNKQSTCVIGHGEAIHLPHVSKKLDYEGELAVVIGKTCRHVPKERAIEVIAGYTICNDVSVRDWQNRSATWTLGKSFDTHGPIGPWIVTADEISEPHNLRIKTWINDELRQSSNTKHLLFNCYDLIEYLSTVMTLEPGDIIATGTSSGVGVQMTPPCYMQVNDIVRIEIEGIGVLENVVIAEPTETMLIV